MWPAAITRLIAIIFMCRLLVDCSATSGQRDGTTPSDASRPSYSSQPTEVAADEESTALATEEPDSGIEMPEPATEEPDSGIEVPEPLCELPPDTPEAAFQIRVFRRWLQDQSVGRQVVIEQIEPTCGDREGSVVIELVATGPAGGLQSLGYALEVYYPDSSWTARSHQRLHGERYPLRIHVEVLLPIGTQPLPRCTWDPETPCPQQEASD
jgi:hypothetical protein